MPKGHWKCMGNITKRKVVFSTSNIFTVQWEDQYPDLTQPLTFDKQAKLKLGEPHSQPLVYYSISKMYGL